MKQEVIQKAEEKPKQQGPNLTGIPTQMKLDFEQRSGLSFDDVRVHYNSDKPARIGALAYTQGNQVHVGPGQERHLRHELGHVVQQKQGIVRPTTYINGLQVNDSPLLERSADVQLQSIITIDKPQESTVIQMIKIDNIRHTRKEYYGQPLNGKVYCMIVDLENDYNLLYQIHLAQSYASKGTTLAQRLAMLFKYVNTKIQKSERLRDRVYLPTQRMDSMGNVIYEAYLGKCLMTAAACRELAAFLQILFAQEGVETGYNVGLLRYGTSTPYRHAWLTMHDSTFDPTTGDILMAQSQYHNRDSAVAYTFASPAVTAQPNPERVRDLVYNSKLWQSEGFFRPAGSLYSLSEPPLTFAKSKSGFEEFLTDIISRDRELSSAKSAEIFNIKIMADKYEDGDIDEVFEVLKFWKIWGTQHPSMVQRTLQSGAAPSF